MHAVYAENAANIYHFIYRKVHHREVAQDLSSQVFVKALRSLDGARAPKSIQSWLFLAARSVIVDYYRSLQRLRTESIEQLRATRSEVPEAVADAPFDLALSEPAPDRVRHILDCLPPRYREVLTLRFLMGQSVADTAAQMHTPVSNLKVLQCRALKMARWVGLADVTERGEGDE